MRPGLLACIGLVLAATPGVVRDGFTSDGQYSVCRFLEFRDCELLTNQMVDSDRFSPEEKRMLKTLKTWTDAADTVTQVTLETTFGPPSLATPIPDPRGVDVRGATWLTDPKGKCPICGVQVIFQNGRLTLVNWSVSDKFFVIWSAPAPPKPAQ